MSTEARSFATYFDHVYIINLPTRPDRLTSVLEELDLIGFSKAHDRISIPHAPLPDDPNGFKSRGVYGNFLSHLGILKEIKSGGLERALILEDDAIFLRSLRNAEVQARVISQVERYPWEMWFAGHRLRGKALSGHRKGVVQTASGFSWAHCYAVHRRGLSSLISYLEGTLQRPRGHPDGGRMYIDGAYSLYRRLHPTRVCLISNPALSIQKGTTSDLATREAGDGTVALNFCKWHARLLRDEFWRWSGVDFRDVERFPVTISKSPETQPTTKSSILDSSPVS